ncbi:MAG TPA: DUF2530 domain-containing protein [Ornithinibacter sp.]|nr:DUF2530 domain-containing protein [Ornithinibacter sp.]
MTTEDPAAQPSGTTEGESVRAAGRGTAAALGASAPTEPLAVPIRTIVLVGTAIWAVALVVTLVVPALHTGERSWWPWSCVAGIALGGFALWYVSRGKGSAADL